MMQVFDVFIGGVLAGKLGRPARRPAVFQFVEEYRRMSQRPVLGQRFEDDLRKKYWGEAQELPPFFANLIPEGHLRQLVERSLGLPANDDLALLVAVGHDLPGALEIRPGYTGADLLDATQPPITSSHNEGRSEEATAFRFSLAGVQMKFSVLLDADKLRLPMHDELGDWIVKFDSHAFPGLPANEFAIMQWAASAGFDVPECRLLPVTALPASLFAQGLAGHNVFLIRRYDRLDGQRIHQEDFAQVAGLRPALKYEQWTYEACARVVLAVSGVDEYAEFIRRLVFMVASGNTDAHLKNWSLLYPDGINAQLTPLYDQVAVVAWPPPDPRLSVEWALKFAGTKKLEGIDDAAFGRLAERSGGEPLSVKKMVYETLAQIVDAWHKSKIAQLLPVGQAQAIKCHWQRVPLLQDMADSLL
jgi:serine/threonine-protein kinase HipA